MYVHSRKRYYDKAFELSKKLAEKECPRGINFIGYCYYNGIGTSVDKKMAVELYQKAANLGNCMAQCNLANMYKDGLGVNKDYIKAFELYQKSAKEDSYVRTLLSQWS